MKTILIILMSALMGLSSWGAQGTAMFASQLTLDSQTGWTSGLKYTQTFPEGACYIRIGIGTNNWPGSIPITNGPGTYKLYMRMSYLADNLPPSVGFTLGDSVGAVTNLSGSEWQNMGYYSPTIAFTNLSLNLTNADTGTVGDYWVAAVYLTQYTNEAPVASTSLANTGSFFIDYTVPGSTNLTDIKPGNMILNSSFELGFTKGWSYGRDTAGANRGVWMDDAITTTTNSGSGSYCVSISDSKARYNVFTPVFRFRGNTNEFRWYTLTFSAKGNGSRTLTGLVVPVIPSVAGLPYSNSIAMTFGTPGTTWVRYTNRFAASLSPSPETYISIQHIGTHPEEIQIDQVQLEEGTNASPWAPMYQVEFALRTRKNGGMFLGNETPRLELVAYNFGSPTYATILTEVFGHDNSLITNIVTSVPVPSGGSTNFVYPPTQIGIYRAVSRVQGRGGIEDETSWTVAGWHPSALGSITNSLFRTHGMSYPSTVESNQVWGVPQTRVMSVVQATYWPRIQPTSNTWNWVESDAAVARMRTNAVLLGALGDLKGEPSWAFVGKAVFTNSLGEFVRTIVARYPEIVDWETDNEPYSLGYYTSAQVANMMTVEVAAIKASNPSARIWAGGGYDSTNNLGLVWALLDATTKSNIYGISCHLYSNPPNANDTDFDIRPSQFQKFASDIGKELINSESGIWTWGHRRTPGGYMTRGTYIYPWLFSEAWDRTPYQAPSTLMRQVLRNVGRGIAFYQYDNRAWPRGWHRPDTQSYLLDPDDSLTSNGSVYFFGASLLGRGVSLGQITNTLGGTNLEAYAFLGNQGQSVLVAWPRVMHTNFLLTLPNTSFGQLDAYGRQISSNSGSVTLGRNPVYMVSTALSTNDLITNYVAATVTSVADTTAPIVQIDIQPSGFIDQYPLFWKWVAIDERWINAAAYPDSVVTRYRINGYSDWSDWNMKRRYLLETNLPAGQFTFEVQTKDRFGLTTNTAIGPPFWTVRRTTNQTLNVGTMRIP